jgi:hypothetical protein
VRFTLLSLLFLASSASCASSDAERLHLLAQRRSGIAIICHRGASEFAKENTLEAYRATFELGADGNEIDIRRTKDGVLVCFHDDILDLQLYAVGDISDHPWSHLKPVQFRDARPFGAACRIPTLEEVFKLHKKHAGLIHLDIKQSGIDNDIVALIEKLDMWPHIVNSSGNNADAIHHHPRYQARTYKGSLYLDHAEVFPEAIAEVLQKPGDDVMVDDPRGVIVALGRRIGKVSTKPLFPDRHVFVDGTREATRPPEIEENRIRNRKLDPDWRKHGLDGAAALRSLIRQRAPRALEVSRYVLWLDDPALIPLNNPQFNVPSSWVDWRMKTVVFPALAHVPGPATQQLCRDYLALSDDEAGKIGPPQFEPAARTLLAISPNTSTAIELMNHRLQVVRGRAILDCLARHKETWALDALRQAAPHALAYIPPQ